MKPQIRELLDQLDNSGDISNLSLRTNEHENLSIRLQIGLELLERNIPNAFLDSSRKEIQALQRTTSEQEDKRRIGIYLGSVYAAAAELAVLSEYVRQHHNEGQSIDEVIQGRAQFDAKDLTHGHAQAKEGRNTAQSAEEIRRKLVQKGSSSAGTSSFAAKELTSTITPANAPPPVQPKREIAQSAGKAVFGSKDISHASEAPSKPKVAEPEKPKPARRAMFESKDLSDPNS